MISLEASWSRAWRNLQLQPPTELFSRLVAAYGESHRRYHTEQHLSECLGHFSEALDCATQPGEVEIALWFHDAIYDLRGKDNEERSADWAGRALEQAGADDALRRRVRALIMATRHEALPCGKDEQLLVDVDLAILGAAPERFEEYGRQVRAEYSWVPGFIYRSKRKEILRSFLARESIYSTDHFKARYEAQARANLARETS